MVLRAVGLDEVNKSVGGRVVSRHRRVALQVAVNHLRQLFTQLHANTCIVQPSASTKTFLDVFFILVTF